VAAADLDVNGHSGDAANPTRTPATDRFPSNSITKSDAHNRRRFKTQTIQQDFGSRSLLGHTRERLRPVLNNDRVLFVVTQDHESFYRRELFDVDRANMLEQPANRGTGVALIATLLQLLQYKPDGIVSIFP
jgi:hypothetical protein